ncbi:MAG TPA: MOSC domain-containing protein [Terriglobia bacterium]|nr:MOSC domain-containing protein [Terriglobia bacterium]
MNLISINVAVPKVVIAGKQEVSTAIFKTQVTGPVRVGKLNLEGDRQADLSVHGGEHKAVYAYSWQNIEYWKKFLHRDDLRPGSFGENLTVDGLLDTEVSIGDELQIGSARFRVTQPRFPCFKLGIAMGQKKFIKTFDDSGRNGFYLSVLQEGVIEAGNEIRRIANTNPEAITVAEFVKLYQYSRAHGENISSSEIRRRLTLGGPPKEWKSPLKNDFKPETGR